MLTGKQIVWCLVSGITASLAGVAVFRWRKEKKIASEKQAQNEQVQKLIEKMEQAHLDDKTSKFDKLYNQVMLLDSKNFYAKALKFFFHPNTEMLFHKELLANYATNDQEHAIASMIDSFCANAKQKEIASKNANCAALQVFALHQMIKLKRNGKWYKHCEEYLIFADRILSNEKATKFQLCLAHFYKSLSYHPKKYENERYASIVQSVKIMSYPKAWYLYLKCLKKNPFAYDWLNNNKTNNNNLKHLKVGILIDRKDYDNALKVLMKILHWGTLEIKLYARIMLATKKYDDALQFLQSEYESSSRYIKEKALFLLFAGNYDQLLEQVKPTFLQKSELLHFTLKIAEKLRHFDAKKFTVKNKLFWTNEEKEAWHCHMMLASIARCNQRGKFHKLHKEYATICNLCEQDDDLKFLCATNLHIAATLADMNPGQVKQLIVQAQKSH